MAFSPDGRQLASTSLDNSATVWDIPGGGPAKTLTGQAAVVAALAVKPDGKEAAVAAGRSVRIWDLAKSASIKELEGFASEVSSVARRQDGAQLAAGDRSHTIRLWKGDFTPDGLIETPADAVLGLAYVPGMPMLVSAGSDGIARLWQLPVAKPKRIDSKGAARVFVVSHEGNRAASAGADKIVRVWTLAEGKLVKEIAGNGQPVIALALCGSGSQAAIGLANKVVRICSVDDGKEIRKVGPLPASITALCFRNDAGQLAVAGDDKVIRVLAAGDTGVGLEPRLGRCRN